MATASIRLDQGLVEKATTRKGSVTDTNTNDFYLSPTPFIPFILLFRYEQKPAVFPFNCLVMFRRLY